MGVSARVELKEYDLNVYGFDPLLSDVVIEHFSASPFPNLDKKMDVEIFAVPSDSSKRGL